MPNHISDEFRGTKEYGLIFAELIIAARHRGTVTYQELAELIGLPTHGIQMGITLGSFVGAISEDEVSHGRPMLSAIVVNVRGEPGVGFFWLARQLGKLNSEQPADEAAFLERERKAVHKTWQRSFSE
jgi:hypothetical protein